jgi:PAS domain-containing protein
MFEFSKGSTNLESEKEKVNTEVKEDKTLNVASSSCDLALDKERLRDILENIPSAIVVLEKPDGKITYANKRAIELHGVNPCGIELEKHAAKLKIYTMEGKVCPTEELYLQGVV